LKKTRPEHLAKALSRYLQIAGWTRIGDRYFVSGLLDVTVKPHIAPRTLQMPVRMEFSSDWPARIPHLYLNSMPAWVRTGNEWHVAQTGWVCLDWWERWADHFVLLVSSTAADIGDIAAQWITRSASYTLGIHLTCHIQKRSRWPKNVPYWAHGNEASEEYAQEKKRLQKSKTHR
jgi:hypothetical protein